MLDPDIFVPSLEFIDLNLHVLMVPADQQQIEAVLSKYLGIAMTYALCEACYHHEGVAVDLLQSLLRKLA